MRRLIAIVAVTLVGCVHGSGRQQSMATATNYSVEVSNMRNAHVMVYFADGGSERLLGSLGIGQSQRYRLNTVSDVVTVSARSPVGTLLYRAELKLTNGLMPSLTVN